MWLLRMVPAFAPRLRGMKSCALRRWEGVACSVSEFGREDEERDLADNLRPGLTRALLKEPLLISMHTCIYSVYLQNAPRTVLWTKSMGNFVQVRIIHIPTHNCRIRIYRAFKNLDCPKTTVRGNYYDLLYSRSHIAVTSYYYIMVFPS